MRCCVIVIINVRNTSFSRPVSSSLRCYTFAPVNLANPLHYAISIVYLNIVDLCKLYPSRGRVLNHIY